MSQEQEQLKKNQEEQEKLVHDLRALVESKSAETAETKAAMEKMNTRIDELEEANTDLQKKLYRMPGGGTDKAEDTPELKSFKKFIQIDKQQHLNADDIKYLRTDSNREGGYLVPIPVINEIVKNITEISGIRQIARVTQIDSKGIKIPTRTAIPTAYWEGEGEEYEKSQSSYGAEEINAYKLTAIVVLTIEQLQDAAFDMSVEINEDVAEAFGVGEGRGFVYGSGVKQPEGILTNPNIPSYSSGVANDVTADALIRMAGELKRGYNPQYILNRRTLARIRTLKDGVGQYLWQSGLAAGQPNTINGYSYVSVIDVPDIGAGAYPVVFGDFKRGYRIIDRISMNVLRDDYTLASQGKVRFVFYRRVGGQVVLPEAMIKLQCAA